MCDEHGVEPTEGLVRDLVKWKYEDCKIEETAKESNEEISGQTKEKEVKKKTKTKGQIEEKKNPQSS